jgi:phage gp37-like protein
MITELAQDMLAKLKTVPALGGRVGLTLGATDSDPLMQDIQVPAAWVLYSGDQNVDAASDARTRSKQIYNFVVYVIIGYGSNEVDMLTNQYPILDSTVASIAGTEILNANVIMNWKYTGQSVVHVGVDRLLYEQRYSIASVL